MFNWPNIPICAVSKFRNYSDRSPAINSTLFIGSTIQFIANSSYWNKFGRHSLIHTRTYYRELSIVKKINFFVHDTTYTTLLYILCSYIIIKHMYRYLRKLEQWKMLFSLLTLFWLFCNICRTQYRFWAFDSKFVFVYNNNSKIDVECWGIVLRSQSTR